MKRHGTFHTGLLSSLVVALILTLIGTIVARPAKAVSAADLSLTQYVNPFIGTSPAPTSHYGFGYDTGDVIPDATYPLGMVQWGPDTTTGIPGNYYYPDNTINGFSLTHFSGRGCSAWGDFPFMPYVGSSASSSTFSHSNESAHPGYYQVHLDGPNVNVELSASLHGGEGLFTYPSSNSSAMRINAGGSTNGSSNASITINTAAKEITGQTTSTVGCGSNHYTLYFAAQFDHAFTQSSGNGTSVANVTFDTTSDPYVHARIGISFISVANAQANRNAEIGSSNFGTIHSAADAAWNARLNSIQVQGGTSDELTNFYTALYHTFFHPNVYNDVNGQYLGFDGVVHTLGSGQHAQYENIPGWDEYRSLTRLRAILAPTEASDLAQSMVNDAQQGDGHLPRWEQANVDSHGMNGDSATVEVADIYAYGNTNFDTAGALTAMINGQSKVREGFNDYISRGYVASSTVGNSAVATQEYTNDDFALSQYAKALGNTSAYNTYLSRSNNWQNVLNTSSGYVQPRNSDGTWAANFSPTNGSGFQETDSAQSTWMETFNMRGLFDKLGGNTAVVNRLDSFFTRLNDGPKGADAYMGNEPSIEIPWEYDFAGAPSHTQNTVRRIQTQLYTNTPGGLPGNDDGGTMSAWYVFSAIGLYPEIPGVAGFVIGSPLFTSVTVRLAGGHTLQINAPAASDTTPYVQSLNVNGQATTSTWLPWNSVKNGTTLDFALGSSATNWGTGANDAPPSFPATNNTGNTFNNEGISSDSNASVGNFDNVGNSYSNNALAAVGFNQGSTVKVNNINFQWPAVAANTTDNWQAAGQVIPVAGSGSTLAFLGSATGGPSSGTATITYTDNSTQTFTLAFSDWTLNHGASQPIAGNSTAAHMTYRNTPNGVQTRDVYMFYTSIGLAAGKTVKSVALPSTVTQGTLHVFSVNVG